jgi:hypothetical protein
MAKTPARAWLYDAYLCLAAANGPYNLGLSESAARDKLKAFFPNVAHFVDEIISVSGDMTKISEHTLATSKEIIDQEDQHRATEDMDRRIRYGAGRLRDGGGRFARPLEGDGDQEETQDGQAGKQSGEPSINDLLRNRQSKLKVPAGATNEDVNDQIRGARE